MAWEPPASDFTKRRLSRREQFLPTAVAVGDDEPMVFGGTEAEYEARPTHDLALAEELLRPDLTALQRSVLQKEQQSRTKEPPTAWSPPEEDFKAAAWEPPAEDFMTTMDAARQALHKGAEQLDNVGPSITDKVAAASGMVYPWTAGMFSGIAAGVESGINLGQYGLGRLLGRPEASNEELRKELSHHPNAELIDKALKKLMNPNDNKSFEAGAAFSGAPIDAAFAAIEHKTGPLGKASAEVAMVLAPFLHGRGKGKVTEAKPGELPTREPAVDLSKPLEFEKVEVPPTTFKDTNLKSDKLTMSSEYDLSRPEPPKYGNEIDFFPDNPDWNIRQHEKKMAEEDLAWEAYNKEKEAVQKEDHRILSEENEGTTPTQGSTPMEKMTKPINNRSGSFAGSSRGRRQSGQGEIFNDLGRLVFDVTKWSKEQLKNIADRLNEKERTSGLDDMDYQTLTTIQGRLSSMENDVVVDAARAAEAAAPYKYKVGDRVKLIDGPTVNIVRQKLDRDGNIQYVTEDPVTQQMHSVSEQRIEKAFTGPRATEPTSLRATVVRDTARELANAEGRMKAMLDGGVSPRSPTVVKLRREIEALRKPPTPPKGPGNQRGSDGGMFTDLGRVISGLFTKKSIEHLDNNHAVAQDHRPWVQLKADLKLNEHPLAATEDIGILNKMFNVMPVMTQLNYFSSRGVQILKNIVSRAQEINNQSIQRFKDAVEHSKDFANLPHKEKKALREVQIKYDGVLNDELANRGLQFLTEDMLRAEGMNERQVKAYIEESKGVSKAWDMIEEALAMAGQEVTRIPGYFPHTWSGSYKLRLYNGNQLVAIKAYSTAYQAKTVQLLAGKELMKEFDATHMEYEAPSSHIKPTDLAVQIAEAIKVSGGRKGFNASVVKLLTRFDELSKRGIIKEALEREANVAGFDAQKGMTLDPVNNGRILRAYNDHMEAAANFWRNAKISKEIYSEYFADIKHLDKTPHLRAAISEFVQRATGQPVNHMKWIDELARATSIKLGLPPNTVRHTVRSLGAWVTFAKLMAGNAKFIGTQVMQPIVVSADIVLMAVQHYKATGKWGDFAGAYAAQIKETFAYELSSLRNADNTKALNWMKKNNKLDVYTADHVNPMKGMEAQVYDRNPLFIIPRHIEERGRGASFIGAYNYFKKIMPEQDAYHAATNTTDMMMGNYEGMNSSSMFTDFGMVGQSVRPFALIRNAYMGKAIMAVQLAVDSLKTLNPKEAAIGVTPLMLQLGSFLAVAGATGFFGFQEWDVWAKYYNATFKPEEPMTRPAEWLKDRGAPQWMTYGLLSNSIGMDVGGSLAAPAMSELAGIPAIDAGVGAFKLAAAIGDGFTWKSGDSFPRPNNAQKFYQGAKPLSPPWLVAFMENEWIAPKQGDMTPGAQNFGAVYQRDSSEKMKSYFGAKSIKESQERTDMNLYKAQRLTGQAWKNNIVERIVNAQLGISGEDMGDLISKAISAQKGFDKDSLKAAIDEERKRRLLDEKTRELSSMVKSNNAADKNYKYEIMRRMGLM